jgi:hypothetical protein
MDACRIKSRWYDDLCRQVHHAEPQRPVEDRNMMPSCVALTTSTDRIRMDEPARVAAALQTRVTRDFAPHCCTGAVIAAAPFEAIEAGYCPTAIR